VKKPWLGLLSTGSASSACYGLLFAFEEEVMLAFTRIDGAYPALPILTAFVFSFAHGAFTGYFWEVLGITARRPQERDA